MDPERFDRLARSLIETGSRRRALAAALAGSLAAAVGLLGRTLPEAAEAKATSGKCTPQCGECQKCDKGQCRKKNGKKHCKKGKCKATGEGLPCANGGRCRAGSCSVTCSDGLKNGTETGVDCGGTCPNKCGVGQGCVSRPDCASAICTSGICQTCTPPTSCAAAAGTCGCVGPPNVATPTCIALVPPPPPPIFGSCPGSCPAGTVCLALAPGVVTCANPCTAP